MAAARGFCDMAAMAKKAGKTADVTHYAMLSAKVNAAFQSAFIDPQMALGGSIEGLSAQKYYDGSVAEAFDWNLLADFGGPVATATLSLFNHLRVDSGGFKRNNDGQSSYDNNEWILVDLRISNALRRAGKTAEADGYLGQLVNKAAANFFLLPELYNDTAGRRADRQVLRLDPDGRLRRRRLHHDHPRPRRARGSRTTAATATRKTRRRVHLLGPVAAAATGGTGGGGSGGTGGGDGDGGTGGGNSDVPYRAACLCDLGPDAIARRTARSRLSGAAVAVPGVPLVRARPQVQVSARRRSTSARLDHARHRKRFGGVVALDGAELEARGRRDPRAVRRERRRQVDAPQDPRRRLRARQLRRRAARRRRAAGARARQRTRARPASPSCTRS